MAFFSGTFINFRICNISDYCHQNKAFSTLFKTFGSILQIYQIFDGDYPYCNHLGTSKWCGRPQSVTTLLFFMSSNILHWWDEGIEFIIRSTGCLVCLVLKQGAVNQLFLGVFLMFLACLDHARWAQFHLGILGPQEWKKSSEILSWKKVRFQDLLKLTFFWFPIFLVICP